MLTIDNLEIAAKNACKGKLKTYGVQRFLKNKSVLLNKLLKDLKSGSYKTSEYTTFIVKEKKERLISRLPFYPDRITHWLINSVLIEVLHPVFTADTYAAIKGRGTTQASYKLRKALKKKESVYCLQIDIRQFFPSVDNYGLKFLLRRKIKDKKFLELIDEIIDSKQGLALGSSLSQHLANFYLSYLDHYIKEQLKVSDIFRYMDDYVILAETKEELHLILSKVEEYLTSLKLELKGNHQIFPIARFRGERGRGIDFVGFVHYKDQTLVRDTIKRKYIRAVKKNKPKTTLAAYNGWLVHSDSITLKRKYESIRNNQNRVAG